MFSKNVRYTKKTCAIATLYTKTRATTYFLHKHLLQKAFFKALRLGYLLFSAFYFVIY
jgi:hypothetical protein